MKLTDDDIAEYQKTSKSLEVGQFNDAVTEFSKAVNKFSGKGTGSSKADSSEETSWFGSLSDSIRERGKSKGESYLRSQS